MLLDDKYQITENNMTLDELAQTQPELPVGLTAAELKASNELAQFIASTTFATEPTSDEFVEA